MNRYRDKLKTSQAPQYSTFLSRESPFTAKFWRAKIYDSDVYFKSIHTEKTRMLDLCPRFQRRMQKKNCLKTWDVTLIISPLLKGIPY